VAAAGKAYRLPEFDEAREFQRVVDKELAADDLRNLPVAVRWRKAAERAHLKWPAIRASFQPPQETNDDGQSQERGERTSRNDDDDSGDDDDDDDSGDDDDVSESEDNSDRGSDEDEDSSESEPDKSRDRRRERKRRAKVEQDRKSSFNSLGSPGKPLATV
jgi:hypothetical protein